MLLANAGTVVSREGSLVCYVSASICIGLTKTNTKKYQALHGNGGKTLENRNSITWPEQAAYQYQAGIVASIEVNISSISTTKKRTGQSWLTKLSRQVKGVENECKGMSERLGQV